MANDEGSARRRRRGRWWLAAFVVAAAALTIAPSLIRDRLARDLCPATVTTRGVSDGAAWEVARSDCGAGRVVWQLRIVPSKGVSTLVYEAEGGPAPTAWTQSGLTGRIDLAAPFDGNATISVPLDLKGRPTTPIRVVEGRRIE
ncbi:hypothetical protein EYW49_09410 [Siculibacillus lacustris]|uniref:Uncharacterized protein n=1 Tax=Siculibacillus lacustris TaxID=1549641 RepID=A0A4Q9VU02_9HYPH|nr:hypothetical protein [Siculibacillus lacustris]TBW38475.1 hypothetical protein EYW49_09410 [Siculibacillus lacustris]